MPNDTVAAPAAAATGAPSATPAVSPMIPTDPGVFDGWAKANEAMAEELAEGGAAAPVKEPEADPPPPAEPAKEAEPAKTAEEEPAKVEPEPGKEVEEEAAPVEEEPAKAEEEAAPAAPDLPVVEFVEGEEFTEFTEKVDKFFDAYDVDPSIVAMRTGYEKQIAALEAQAGGQVEINENVRAAVEAFSAIDEFRKDDAAGRFVPKTNEAVAFVQATKPPEVFKQFVVDAMSAPSPKYKHLGFTMLHEMYVDAGVPPHRMDEFIKYVSGEAVPPPLYPDLPENVPQPLAEAYMKNSALRRTIEDTAETLAWSEADRALYPEQYAEAKAQFEDAIAGLQAQQAQIDKQREDKASDAQKAIDQQNAFNTTVLAGTQEIQKAELVSFANDLSEKLAVFIPDAAARSLQVLSYQQLIVNALADDVYGADARAALKAQGIDIPFSKAQTLFQTIQDAVAQRELILMQTKDEKAANKGVEKQLTNALRELGVLRRQVIGKVAQVVTKSYTAGAMKPAGDKPQLRPVLKGGREEAVRSTAKVNFQDPAEAGKWYRDNLFGGANQ